ncbi:MAG: molybdenum cofactor biosynthesis F family protein [Oscillospiraceae bacterium]|jgi:hypothetical protein|nr:molybdenum cofactor biosynthesis F family protein [Oscillospiraceae bacterium]
MAEKPYFGIHGAAPKFEGMSRYRDPLNYDLAGRSFCLTFDDGEGVFVEFKTGDVLLYAPFGTAGTIERYDCAKGAQTVYFVNFELTAKKPRTNITLILDTEEHLLTQVTTITGFDEKYPYLCDSSFKFGTALTAGLEPPAGKRHAFTRDLIGKRIHWHYAPDVEIVHIYYCADYCRVMMPPGVKWGDIPAADFNAMLEGKPYDEKAAYIKIKENLYLVSVVEQNMAKTGFTGNSLLFLIDTHRVHDVGRSFGHTGYGTPEGVRSENYIFGAFGDFVESDGYWEAKPNIYLNKQD